LSRTFTTEADKKGFAMELHLLLQYSDHETDEGCGEWIPVGIFTSREKTDEVILPSLTALRHEEAQQMVDIAARPEAHHGVDGFWNRHGWLLLHMRGEYQGDDTVEEQLFALSFEDRFEYVQRVFELKPFLKVDVFEADQPRAYGDNVLLTPS
jgi:hypothetical protein